MARSDAIQLLVITPERQVLDTPAEAVVIPAHDGELGVLRERAPLMCELGIGQLRYTHAGAEERTFIDGGFAQIFENRVIVLTSRALPAAQITADVLAAAERSVAEARGFAPEVVAARARAQERASVLRRMRGAS